MSQHVNLLTEDIVKQYGNTFGGKVKHSCRTARSTNMHLTNQFRPAFRLPSLQFAGENEQHVVVMEISWGGWQTLCVPRFMPRCCPKLRLQMQHILRNGNGARLRTHGLCWQDDVNRRANPLANWYLLLLKCSKLVDTFHLVFQAVFQPLERETPPRCRPRI